MASSAEPPPSQDDDDNYGDGEMASFSFSSPLRFTGEMIFGILALLGCMVIQCLIVSWIVLARAQTRFVLLQAQLLRKVYVRNADSHPSVAPQRTTNTKVETTQKQYSPPRHPVELPAAVSAPPEPISNATLSNWQTKTLTSRRMGTGRHVSEQVDAPLVLAPSGSDPGLFASGNDNKTPAPMSTGAVSARSMRAPIRSSLEWNADVSRRSLHMAPPGLDQQTPPWAKTPPSNPAGAAHPRSSRIPSSISPARHGWDTNVPGLARQVAFEKNGIVVRLPPTVPSSVKSSGNNKPKAIPQNVVSLPPTTPSCVENSDDNELRASSQNIVTVTRAAPSCVNGGGDNEPKAHSQSLAYTATYNIDRLPEARKAISGTKRIARGSVIKKVQSAEHEVVKTVEATPAISTLPGSTLSDSTPADSIEGSSHTPDFSTIKADYSRVQPAPFSELRHNLLYTSLVKETPVGKSQNVVLPPLASLNQENAARHALIEAFGEREVLRVKLIASYTLDHAMGFSDKAETYTRRRKELAALMPTGHLSTEDAEMFPYLSATDTYEPRGRGKGDYSRSRDWEMLQVASSSSSSSEYGMAHFPPSSKTPLEDRPRQAPLPQDPPREAKPLETKPLENSNPLVTKALKSYQVLLQTSKNVVDQCSKCNSNFCTNGFEGTGKLKLKTAKDLYLRTRGSVLAAHDAAELPDSLLKQLPEIKEC